MRDPFSPDLEQMAVVRGPMLEEEVQEKSVGIARRAGWWARKFSSPSNRSVHDYIFGKNDFVFFVEFKRNGITVPTDKQKDEHDAMRKCGITRQCVIDTVEKFAVLFAQMQWAEKRQTQVLAALA